MRRVGTVDRWSAGRRRACRHRRARPRSGSQVGLLRGRAGQALAPACPENARRVLGASPRFTGRRGSVCGGVVKARPGL
jgi:hypothetical protein